MLPIDLNQVLIEYIGYSTELVAADWTDFDLANFYKNYELNVVAFPNIDYKKFKKLIEVYEIKYLHVGCRIIKFGFGFDQQVKLPTGIHTVSFKGIFNQPIELADWHTYGFF